MSAPKRPQPRITTDEPVGAPKVGQPGTPMGAPKRPQPGAGAPKGSNDLLRQLAKKKAQVAVPTPNRPAGKVGIGMGMRTPKRPASGGGTNMGTPKPPAPGGFGKGNPTPKRPDSTFRIS